MKPAWDNLSRFLDESNMIEGMAPSKNSLVDVKFFREWLSEEKPSTEWMEKFVSYFQPGAFLRDYTGADVRVGNYYPPRGGAAVRYSLGGLLKKAQIEYSPYILHQEYESLHPFIDGNGRSGRALWAWQMINQWNYDLSLGFLHKYYYQSLENI